MMVEFKFLHWNSPKHQHTSCLSASTDKQCIQLFLCLATQKELPTRTLHFFKSKFIIIVSGKTRQKREEKTKKSVSTQCPHSYNLEKG